MQQSEFVNQYGTFFSPQAFLAANMEQFIRDRYKERLEKLCERNMETSPQFQHAKDKYLHWAAISDNLQTCKTQQSGTESPATTSSPS
jgi:hypothetical protein